jgi:DNA modification methylase
MAKKKQSTGKMLFDLHDAADAFPAEGYSGNRPNSALRTFVTTHSHLYDATNDEYSVAVFDTQITTTKVNAIYNMHTYWSKKPHEAIRQYIRHYTSPHDIVLDVFCGSGSTALAALIEDRAVVAIDRSPAATFITKNYCSPVEPDELNAAFETLRKLVEPELSFLYQTTCSKCDKQATIYATVHSALYRCSRCLAPFALYDAPKIKEGYNKVTYYCPNCKKRDIDEVVSLRSQREGSYPVAITYNCNHCGIEQERRIPYPRKESDYPDLTHLDEIAHSPIKGWVPNIPMMYVESGEWGLLQRPYHGDIRSITDFYSPRNLRAIAFILEVIKTNFQGHIRDALLFALEAISMNMSKLQGYSENPMFPNNMMKGTLYTPPVWREYNVLSWLEGKIRNLVSGYKAIKKESIEKRGIAISTQSACDLSQIPSNSIDYVFTDPPYSNKIQFGELNFIWEGWLQLSDDWKGDEIIVNNARNLGEPEWTDKMRLAMAECYRVLKPGRCISLCYHDSSEGTWAAVQDIMSECGFIIEDAAHAVFIDTDRKSWKQIVADKVTKRDLVLNYRKPKPMAFNVKEVHGPEDTDKLPKGGDIATFAEFSRQIVRDFLIRHPGATKDRIYDELVSRLVISRSMEAHDFDGLLRSIAEEVQQPVKEDLFRNKEPDLWGSHIQSRWYLKDTADHVDHAEQAKEEAAAKRLGKFMGDQLKISPEFEGVHYSDLFEQYLPIKDKPRRLLADWLPEYFIKTASGTWRLPDKEEGEQLAKLREAGTLRRIKRFANALIDGVPMREKDRPGSDVDLLDWLRQCRRAGLYEQGRAIYEKGGLNSANLTDEQQIEAEDDYRICVRRGSSEETKPKQKSKKKSQDDE